MKSFAAGLPIAEDAVRACAACGGRFHIEPDTAAARRAARESESTWRCARCRAEHRPINRTEPESGVPPMATATRTQNPTPAPAPATARDVDPQTLLGRPGVLFPHSTPAERIAVVRHVLDAIAEHPPATTDDVYGRWLAVNEIAVQLWPHVRDRIVDHSTGLTVEAFLSRPGYGLALADLLRVLLEADRRRTELLEQLRAVDVLGDALKPLREARPRPARSPKVAAS